MAKLTHEVDNVALWYGTLLYKAMLKPGEHAPPDLHMLVQVQMAGVEGLTNRSLTLL